MRTPADWPREEFFAWFDQERSRLRADLPNDFAIAKAAGMSHTTLSGWRSGRQAPTMQRLASLAQVLGIDHREVWVRAGLMSPEDVGLLQDGSVDAEAWSILLGELLASARVSQASLADQVGVDEKTIGRWRRQEFAPKPENVRDVARALDYPPLHALVRVGFLTAEEADLTDGPAKVPQPLPQPLQLANRILSDPVVPNNAKELLTRGINAAVELWADTMQIRAPREPSAAERARKRSGTKMAPGQQ